MPTVFRSDSFRFFFYSDEGNEPPHIHVEKGDGVGKFWTDPIQESYVKNFTSREQKSIRRLIDDNQSLINDTWDEYFS